MLTEAVQIPENFVLLAFAWFTELTFYIMFLSNLSALAMREKILLSLYSSNALVNLGTYYNET